MNVFSSVYRQLTRSTLLRFVVCLGLIAGVIAPWLSHQPSVQAWNLNPIGIPNQSGGYNLTPAVAISSNGMTYATWIFTNENFGFTSLFYTRGMANAAGNVAWEQPIEIASFNRYSPDGPSIEVGPNGRVHILYADPSGAIRYFENRNNGDRNSWGASVQIGNGFNPSITVGGDNQVYAVWSDIRSNSSRAYFKWKTADGVWTAEKPVTVSATEVNRGADIAVSGVGAGAIVHIVSQHKLGNGSFVVSYVRDTPTGNFNNDRFLAQELSAADLSLSGGVRVTADPVASRVAIVWGAAVSDVSEPLAVTQSTNIGVSWSPVVYIDLGRNLLAKDPEVTMRNQILSLSTTILQWNGSAVIDTSVWTISYNAVNGQWSTWTQIGTVDPSLASSIASNGNLVVALWSSTSGDNDFIFYNVNVLSTIPPTPTPPTATPIPPVNFTLTRTSVSPTTNPNINASLTGFEGSPNEMRYSPTPFAANDTTVGWIGLQAAITVNTSSAVANCGVTIYAQVRNTNTGQVSAVKSVSAVVDTAVQSQVAIYTMEHAPQPRPATAQAPNEQNFAPDGADPNYTRSMTFVYRIPQEPVPCVGIKSYKVESFVRSPSPFPNLEEGIAPFQPFSTGLDVGGIGSPEQTVTANVVLTDTLNNQAAFAKTVFYDDDPPILVNGGSISFTNGITSSISVVPITFDADVTDDGYTNSAPANQKYWGVWVVATANATLPTPAVFAQYGRVHYVAPSSEQVDYVSLTNDSAPALRESGTRFVHIRFLDGAGNYSEQGITSPQITLSNPFQEGLRTYLPVIAR